MVNFRICNPTEIVFGENSIETISELVPAGTKVLLLYGGGSIKRNGVYGRVCAALKDRPIVEFGGIEPNPVYETIAKAAAICRREGIELVLGVGGGSVIDAAKFLATIVPLDVPDAWDHLVAGKLPPRTLPVGAVLTLPATGSESNPVSVISRQSTHLKIPFANEAARPRFAILDPSTMKSLDIRQLQNGVVDAFTHVMEQYLTSPANTPVQFGFSEAILSVLIEWGPRLIERNDAESRENVMFAANQALNGLIGSGVPQDWSTHMIGHALTALYGIDHARTLSMVMPAVMRYRRDAKRAMLVRYARRVWHIEEPDETKAATEAIMRTEVFFKRMGCPIRLSDVAPIEVVTSDVVSHLDRAGQTALGEDKRIGLAEVAEILKIAA